MATLGDLKQALRAKSQTSTSPTTQPLSDLQYSVGFEHLLHGSGIKYRDFVVSRLSLLLEDLFVARNDISILEIGPGPQSVLWALPEHLRRKFSKYTAFEPNHLFATKLESWLCSTAEATSALPCLGSQPDIRRAPFTLNSKSTVSSDDSTCGDDQCFDLILFCHSMYGLRPKHDFIEKALGILHARPDAAVVIVHRKGTLRLDKLACYRLDNFHGLVGVNDTQQDLDHFAAFIAGMSFGEAEADDIARAEWRKVCHTLGRRDSRNSRRNSRRIFFNAPDIMVTLTRHATTLPDLLAQVPSATEGFAVKNREARLRHPAAILRPTEIQHVQQCVEWAKKHRAGLTVIGGGHSGQCLWSNVVALDMGAFDKVHILPEGAYECGSGPLVVAGGGCQSVAIVRESLAAGLTVPLGSRPSVGAGLWLQGGIGHLARRHGLTCDAIVGAIIVDPLGRLRTVGSVPEQHRPVGASPGHDDLLWAMKGAGTNFGIFISVTFKAYPAPTFIVWEWVLALDNRFEPLRRLIHLGQVASTLGRDISVDAYLYSEAGKLRLGVSMIEACATKPAPRRSVEMFGIEASPKVVDGIGLFTSEMYMSGMHGGHGGGKTSSFKRCLFLKRVGRAEVVDVLVEAMKNRPSLLCYFHLLQGGQAVADMPDTATAFGCRDWDYACVVTGTWLRDQDGTYVARAAMEWVYTVAGELLPLSSGVYGADLGPDPRDAVLAPHAFGPNRPRLANLKQMHDPYGVLRYACPLPRTQTGEMLVVLVTGEHGAGKDYCADAWASYFATHGHRSRAVSISEVTKREYAAATGADLSRLLRERAYKEDHRPALTRFFQNKVQQNPRMLEQHLTGLLRDAPDVDVIFITGMREEAPVSTYSHLLPGSRLIEVRVEASPLILEAYKRSVVLDCPSQTLTFYNHTKGPDAAKEFAERHLLTFLHEDLKRLAELVHTIPNYPRPSVDFRHVISIAQAQGGLSLCTTLLERHFLGDFDGLSAIVCCEASGFIFASALAERVGVPLTPIRKAGKLPTPTLSVAKPPSHISSSANAKEEIIEIWEPFANQLTKSVLVVDDVLATGRTLLATLQLLGKAGVEPESIHVLVVAEFPLHRGRELLHKRGFGKVRIASLLIYDGL